MVLSTETRDVAFRVAEMAFIASFQSLLLSGVAEIFLNYAALLPKTLRGLAVGLKIKFRAS